VAFIIKPLLFLYPSTPPLCCLSLQDLSTCY
jgi:hypothetical protein